MKFIGILNKILHKFIQKSLKYRMLDMNGHANILSLKKLYGDNKNIFSLW